MQKKLYACIVLNFAIAPSYVLAASSCESWFAKVVSIQGAVDVKYHDQETWEAVHKEGALCFGDGVRTGKHSRVVLMFTNKSVVTLDQNATMIFPPPPQKAQSWFIKLLEGSAFFRSRRNQELNIHTPFINAVHKGTEFLVTVTQDKTDIAVFDGGVLAENSAGFVRVKQGFNVTAQVNQVPRLQTLTVTPDSAVQWALYYPPIVDYPTQSSAGLQATLNAYSQGDLPRALNLLGNMPESQRDAHYDLVTASLLLSVGRVDEAQPLLEHSLKRDPNNSDLVALQAIIAVAKNQQEQALTLAHQAVRLNATSAVAQIALSYAYQAQFKIEEALNAAQASTQLASNNALAWARFSELQLATGHAKPALQSAQKAQALNPNLARIQIIKGFTELADGKIEQGQNTFERATDLDSSDPIARLGLGLAKIRQGQVEDGKSELELAVNLDPNNAVLRSYLGKSFYELKNPEFAGKEFELAKTMDSKDPTPWFYDAILKQTINRPVAALHDMQKAIELNDNRGVYRSSLLLDKDLAARSAAQGRIYNDLGFQRLGLVEGWKSVNTDPSNYSAHRLLADSYASQPRHEVARVSELLQSQLLQPLNITPVQPQLAQSNILIVDGMGPSSLSFNEYNPLFARNRFALQASGIVGSNNTFGDTVTHSGLWNNTSYSLGQYHYETNGYRPNNFLKQDIYNAFIQSNVTDALNLQAEFRHEERENGDLSVNLKNIAGESNNTETRNINSYRIGGRYTFSPESSLIGSLIYQDVDLHSHYPDVLMRKLHRTGFITELQHQYTSDQFSSITGFGHINQRISDDLNYLDGGPSESGHQDLTRTVIYNYSNININEKLSTTLGLSYDTLQHEGYMNVNPINPKLGVIWKPWSSTTLRTAFFRTLNITRTSNQTIEPTQVAGFNQLFDDINGTVSWRYGAALDHVFSKSLSAGLEYSERQLNVPILGYKSYNWHEKLGRGYVYLTPHDWISLGIEYFYERVDRQSNAIGTGVRDVQTHWVPVTFNLFHPSGLSFMLKATYVNQSGIFDDLGNPYNGNSDFCIVDLNASYRLPSRYGMINFGVKNLFNNKFQYQNTNQQNSNEVLFAPAITLFTQINLAY